MKSGRILVLLLIGAGGLGVLINGTPIFARLLYLGLLLGFGSWLWMALVARSLRVHRTARVPRANVGEIFEENFTLENRGPVLAPWVEVSNDSLLPYAAGSRVFTLLPGRQRRTYLARSWLTRRGTFPLGPTRVSTGDPFGFFRSTRRVEPTQSLVVLPMLFDLPTFIHPRGLLPGGQVIRRKSADVTPHAAGVREYVHGDVLKRIHWPSSVRRSRLMVKEFEQDPQAETWIVLDCHASVHSEKPTAQAPPPLDSILFGRRPEFKLPPSSLEYSVSIAASLVHYLLGQGRAVGFVSSGQPVVIHPAERSDRQEAKILETLAFVQANGSLSIAALVAVQASQLPQGSTMILVTPTVEAELLAAADDLKRRRLRPLVILLDAASFNGFPGSGKLAASLRERRVPVCPIACDSNLSLALAGVSTAFGTQQDMHSWHKPVLSHSI